MLSNPIMRHTPTAAVQRSRPRQQIWTLDADGEDDRKRSRDRLRGMVEYHQCDHVMDDKGESCAFAFRSRSKT